MSNLLWEVGKNKHQRVKLLAIVIGEVGHRTYRVHSRSPDYAMCAKAHRIFIAEQILKEISLELEFFWKQGSLCVVVYMITLLSKILS